MFKAVKRTLRERLIWKPWQQTKLVRDHEAEARRDRLIETIQAHPMVRPHEIRRAAPTMTSKTIHVPPPPVPMRTYGTEPASPSFFAEPMDTASVMGLVSSGRAPESVVFESGGGGSYSGGGASDSWGSSDSSSSCGSDSSSSSSSDSGSCSSSD